MMARSRAARLLAVSADSILPPRPRLGRRRTSRTRASASEVRASACLGAGARLRQPLMASATTGWRAGLSPFSTPAAAWKWDMAERACCTLAMDRPVAAKWPR